MAQPKYEHVLTETRERVGIITMNRPDSLNTLHPLQQREMREAVIEYDNDPTIGAMVLTGAGRVFCAGADISAWSRNIEGEEDANPDDAASRPGEGGIGESWADLFSRVKPVVIAFNGAAVGAGLTLALGADFRIASENARFSLRFAAMGVTPELQSSMIFPQLVGLQNSLDMMLSGKFVTAAEAREMGFVGEVVSAEKLLDLAVERAGSYAANHPDTTRAVKSLVWKNMVESDLKAVTRSEGKILLEAMQTEAHAEAVRAFMEKRQPDHYSDG